MDITANDFLQILKSGGVLGWNNWYRKNPGAWLENHSWDFGKERPHPPIGIDLSRADFSGMELDGIILDGANLEGANFLKSSLRGARMRCVEGTGALFIQTDLRMAEMDLSVLTRANFSFADLRGASLHWVQVDSATTFRGARLSGSHMERLPKGILHSAEVRRVEESWRV